MPKFADSDDVALRYEGDIPSERADWVETRLGDVENALMGLVPSLRKPLPDITADSVAAGDPDRLARVKSLVCDKVLDLYRNPTGLSQKVVDDVSYTWSGRGDLRSGQIGFTDSELDGVKLRRRRSRVGTIPVAPWKIAW